MMVKSHAKDLLDCLQYEEALQIYDTVYEREENSFTREDYMDYIRCLRMCNNNEKALRVCKDLYSHTELYENDRTFNYHNQIFAAIMYDCYISNFDSWAIQDEDRFFNAVDTILSIVNQEQSFSYENAVFKALDYLSKKVIKDIKRMYQYLTRVNPEKLSDETLTYIDDNGNIVEIGVNKDKWDMYYNLISKELQEL
jgi:hypothetical protein